MHNTYIVSWLKKPKAGMDEAMLEVFFVRNIAIASALQTMRTCAIITAFVQLYMPVNCSCQCIFLKKLIWLFIAILHHQQASLHLCIIRGTVLDQKLQKY